MKYLILPAIVILLSGCGPAEPPQLLTLAEQTRDRHISATLGFASALEQYALNSKQRADELSKLVASGDSSELTNQEKTRLAELMAKDATTTEHLENASFVLVDSTLDVMALTSVAYEACRLSGIQTEIAAVVDNLHRHYGDAKDVREQYRKAVKVYGKQLDDVDRKSECSAFKTLQPNLEELIRKGAHLLGNQSEQQAI